jgi:hypothetical protein
MILITTFSSFPTSLVATPGGILTLPSMQLQLFLRSAFQYHFIVHVKKKQFLLISRFFIMLATSFVNPPGTSEESLN